MDEDEDVIRAYGDLQMALNPLPPGLDWDYFQFDPWQQEELELSDISPGEESPAIDAVFDWGDSLIVEGVPGTYHPIASESSGVPGIGCDDCGGTCGEIGADMEDVEICEKAPATGAPMVAGGERFRKLANELALRGHVRNPAALAAWIGRRKYGARRFAEMAAAGRRG